MPSNKQAADKLHDAIVTLLLSNDSGKTPAQKQRITASINLLKKEFDAVVGRTPSATYAEITGKLSAASNRLKKIRNDRNQMANGLVNATKILNSLNGVLGLLS